MRLSNAALSALPLDVARPAYDRAAARVGIVHLGVGAFHRAHQAVYTDDAMARGGLDWGIAGVSLRSPDTRDALAPQDGLRRRRMGFTSSPCATPPARRCASSARNSRCWSRPMTLRRCSR